MDRAFCSVRRYGEIDLVTSDLVSQAKPKYFSIRHNQSSPSIKYSVCGSLGFHTVLEAIGAGEKVGSGLRDWDINSPTL